MDFKIPFHHTFLDLSVENERLSGVLASRAHGFRPEKGEKELILDALSSPIGSERLSRLCADKKNILIITSDHTRPVPSHLTLPALLEEIRSENPGATIKILIATGFHRLTTREEMVAKFGRAIVSNEEILIHDARDDENMTHYGLLPSGGELFVNSEVARADFVIADGFIEPHFFAGFSGGRKSILPGVASQKTVFANHCAKFIDDPRATTGNLKENPIHEDMVFAAKACGLRFILNTVIDSEKKVIAAFAGDLEQAHEKGCEFLRSLAAVRRVPCDIAVTSNAGYPLDQNLYQAVKGMSAAEKCVRPGGVIVIAAACEQGHGGEDFYLWFKNSSGPEEVYEKILKIPQEKTAPDQWEAQILARILLHAHVVLVSPFADKDLVRDMGMKCVDSFAEALSLAESLTSPDAKIAVIPDGVGVIVE